MKYFICFCLCFFSLTYGENLFLCGKCYTGTIFGDYVDSEYNFGFELNRWIHWFDNYSSLHEMRKQTNNNFIKKWIWFGFGGHVETNQDFDQLYFSPYLMAGFLGMVGLSAGPEIGYLKEDLDAGASIRIWLTFVGIDIKRTYRTPAKVYLYFYLPVYVPWIDAYD